MKDRVYISDFCYDLNYTRVILYIGEVDPDRLRKALTDNMVNKMYRLDYVLDCKDPAMRDFIYVENCDLQDLSWPIYEYIKDGYTIHILREDSGKYYVEQKL